MALAHRHFPDGSSRRHSPGGFMPAQKSVRFGTEETEVPIGSHVCLLYRTEQERDNIAVPFVREGIHDGAFCRYVVDEQTAEHLQRGLAECGINVDAVQATGQFKI